MLFQAHFRDKVHPQSLRQHAEKTAEYCSEAAATAGLSVCGRLLGWLHDMGKATPEFQDYLLWCLAHPDDNSRRGSVIHAGQGAEYIYQRYSGGNGYEKLCSTILSMVICSHHGILPDCVALDGTQPLYERLSGEKYRLLLQPACENYFAEVFRESECDKLFSECVEEMKRYFARCGGHEKKCGPIWISHLSRFLLSCLSYADCRDTAEFMCDKEMEPKTTARERSTLYEVQVKQIDNTLDMPAKDDITKLRQVVYRRCSEKSIEAPGLRELYVPTGGGKTFSSLRFGLGQAALYGKRRVIYVIPFLSILEQNADDIRKILGCEVQEFHSGVLPDQNDPDAQPQFAEYFTAPIVLTTMVQFLNAFFGSNRGALRRMNQFCNSVLIFDEVQALPLNCVYLFNSAVDFLVTACGATVVLCSATQPLLTKTQSHPLNHGRAPEPLLSDCEALFAPLKRTRIVDARTPGGMTVAELAAFVQSKLADTGGALIICNTKRDAARVYKELCENESGALLFHLSTAMCPQNRRDVLEEVKQNLLKKRNDDNALPVVCVSTQLIEAGVNVSFPCVIRVLAGADNIAQAAGRCNRNGEDACREVYVVNLQGEKLKHLPDIQAGQRATERVLREVNSDLLSRRAMDAFYRYYFFESKEKMDYPLKDGGSIYDLLSMNHRGVGAVPSQRPALLPQAFEEAARSFEAIDGCAATVLVPYKEAGQALIAELLKKPGARRMAELVPLCQQFSVGIFEWQKKALLKLGALHETPDGILYIDEQYYNEKTGLLIDERAMPFLSVD